MTSQPEQGSQDRERITRLSRLTLAWRAAHPELFAHRTPPDGVDEPPFNDRPNDTR